MTTFSALPGTPGGASPISILLVDDQPFVAMAVARLLASEPDMTVHCCHVAVEAVATAIRLVPSLILQDLRMPEIDGLALLVAYRRNPLTAATPVVVLSGNDDGAARAQAAAAGASGYLVKLPTKDDLIACIRQQVARAGVRPSSRPVPPAPRTSSSWIAASSRVSAPVSTIRASWW